MRGPYQRLKYDLRRVFECPLCGNRERVSAEFTNRLCACQKSTPPTEAKWMRMVDEGDGPKSPRAMHKAATEEAAAKASQGGADSENSPSESPSTESSSTEHPRKDRQATQSQIAENQTPAPTENQASEESAPTKDAASSTSEDNAVADDTPPSEPQAKE